VSESTRKRYDRCQHAARERSFRRRCAGAAVGLGYSLLTGCTGRLTPVEKVLIRQRSVPFPGDKRRGRSGRKLAERGQSGSNRNGRISCSERHPGSLPKARPFARRARGGPRLAPEQPRHPPGCRGPAPVTGMSSSGTRAGSRALHGADSGPERSVRFSHRRSAARRNASAREKRRSAG
jgi:hypothetical protein